MALQDISPAGAQAVVQIAFSSLKVRRDVSAVHSIDVVVGGQFGSEAKGHVTQQIIRRKVQGRRGEDRPVLNIRVAGPNAGHTTYAEVETYVYTGDSSDERGVELRPFAFRQLPVGIVEDAATVFCGIAAGSEIELAVLLDEIKMVRDAGLWPINRLLVIDPEATMLYDTHKAEEGDADLVHRIGSTGKGIGAARSDRIMRVAKRLADDPMAKAQLTDAGAVIRPLDLLYSVPGAQSGYNLAYQVVIEGTQGYGLGLHAGAYPQSTSSDCRAIDFLAMAGLSPWSMEGNDHDRFKVWVVVRPYPIRVAGNSGPLKDETNWDKLGLPEERTTVTRKVRRVGGWDSELAEAAVRANGGGYFHSGGRVALALSMADQIDPSVAGTTEGVALYNSTKVNQFIDQIQAETGAMVDLVTTSPSTAVWLIA